MHSFVLATIKTSFVDFDFLLLLPLHSFLFFLLCCWIKKTLMGVCVYIQRDESNRCRVWPLRKRSSYQSVCRCFVSVVLKLKEDQNESIQISSLNLVRDYFLTDQEKTTKNPLIFKSSFWTCVDEEENDSQWICWFLSSFPTDHWRADVKNSKSLKIDGRWFSNEKRSIWQFQVHR